MTFDELKVLDEMLTRLRAHGYVVQRLEMSEDGLSLDLAPSPEDLESRSNERPASRSERTHQLARVP